MSDPELLARYNYDSLVPATFEPWMRFDASPPLGTVAPDFPLWPRSPGPYRRGRAAGS